MSRLVEVDFANLYDPPGQREAAVAVGFGAHYQAMLLIVRLVAAMLGETDKEALESTPDEGLVAICLELFGAYPAPGDVTPLGLIMALTRQGTVGSRAHLGAERYRLHVTGVLGFVLGQRADARGVPST